MSDLQKAAERFGVTLEGYEHDGIAEIKHKGISHEHLKGGMDVALIHADERWKAIGLYGHYVLHARLHDDHVVGEIRDHDGNIAKKLNGNLVTLITSPNNAPVPEVAVRGGIGGCIIEAGYTPSNGLYVGMACNGKLLFFISSGG